MYKLIIAEDEERVRKGLTDNVDWKSFGFEVSGSVGNGHKALELMEENVPDVLLTDIKMPIMSGLELMRLVKDKHPQVKIVVLSGYGEFDFVKQALECGALEYILKPTQIKDIENAFAKAKKVLDEENTQREARKVLELQLKESLPLLRNKFLNDLIKGNLDPIDNIDEKLKYLELDIGNRKSYCVLSLNIDDIENHDKKYMEKDKQIMKFEVINLICRILDNYKGCIVFDYSVERIVILLCSDQDSNFMDSLKYRIAEEIRNKINSTLNIGLTIGIGRVQNELRDIYISFNESSFAIQYKLYEGSNSIIDVSDFYPFDDISNSLSRKNEGKLIEKLRLGDRQQVYEILNSIFNEILANKRLSMDYVQRVCLELLISGSRYISEIGGDFKDIFPVNIISYSEISKYDTISDIRGWMTGIFNLIMDYVAERRKQGGNNIIHEIRKYILDNYCEDITLKIVAKAFYINPEYLSRLFKRVTGQNFIDYLTEVRIAKAMELIRSNKDLKIYEIAEKVGYKDVKYFSRVFKAYSNKNPYSYKIEEETESVQKN